MTSQKVVITDQMRTPDERVTVRPFRHPWIKGTDVDPECGRTWHDHGWIDRGDHGFTVCPTEAERPDVAEARVREAQGPCTCPPWHPDMDGPEEDCAQHGRPYAYWVEYARELEQRGRT